MEITLIVIGKTNAKYLIEGLDEYTRRLKHYITYNIKGKQKTCDIILTYTCVNIV